MRMNIVQLIEYLCMKKYRDDRSNKFYNFHAAPLHWSIRRLPVGWSMNDYVIDSVGYHIYVHMIKSVSE